MSIEEMPIREKYNMLLDDHILSTAVSYVLHKEIGTLDKANALLVKATTKAMVPKYLGPVFKLLKVLSPGRTAKQVINQAAYAFQEMLPLSNIELSWVSDREAVMTISNCERLRRTRGLVKKTGLDVDPKELCNQEYYILKEIGKEFKLGVTWELTENGCRCTVNLI